MISQQTLDGLKSIGLNLYERKIYTALLAKGVSSAGSLAEMAQVPRSRAYDVLESLADKGFVIVQQTKPIKYVAVQPSVALDKTKDILKRKFSTNVSRIDAFSKNAALNELNSLYSSGVSLVQAADLTGSFKGSYSIDMQLTTMFKKAESSIDIITSEGGLKALAEMHSDLFQKAKNRGLSIRIAAPITNANSGDAELLRKVASVRNLSTAQHSVPAGRMIIVDGNQTLVSLTDDDKVHPTQHTSFWTASDHFAKGFAQATFNMIWDHLKE